MRRNTMDYLDSARRYCLVGLCIGMLLVGVNAGHGNTKKCEKESSSCEFFLEIDHWFPMRLGFMQKVYINSTDGKVYKYLDDTHAEINPDTVVLADGSDHERVLTLFNKTMPGPTLIVYKNQEVIVHVKNLMLSESISIHFHGIEMRGTPWMDGAAFVTQCPLMPGQTFTYRFRPNRKGTFFYHAHLGMNTWMGLVTPFFVNEANAEEMEEHIMVIQDYNNRYDGDYAKLALVYGHFRAGGIPWSPSYFIDGTIDFTLDASTTLINGRGRVYDNTGRATTHTPLSVFSVSSGIKYRFRVICAISVFQYKISVYGHQLQVISIDGNDIDPVSADYVLLHSGERADFIVNANQEPSNYWIRVESTEVSNDQPAYAILRYEGAQSVEPSTVPKECIETAPCIVINCQFPSMLNWTCIDLEHLNNLDSDDPAPDPETPEQLKEYFLNTGIAFGDDGLVYGQINGASFKLPSVSALTQPKEVTGICDESDQCGPEKMCICNRPLNIKFGDVVQINFVNMGFDASYNHPMHIHGYSFHVVKVGFGDFNQTSNRRVDSSDVDCNTADRSKSLCNNPAWTNRDWTGGNIPGQKITKAIRKDTIVVPANGYVTVRFKVDNPGLWLIHCHVDSHFVLGGMALLLNDSFSRIPPPPKGFPECRSFPAPEWLTNTETEQTNNTPENEQTEKDEGKFAAEVFWGIVGALLFVIFLQFVVSIFCLQRSYRSGQYSSAAQIS